MATSGTGFVPRRRARGHVRRAGHVSTAWVAWVAVVAALWALAEWIGGVADPIWSGAVALVVVIGIATVSAPPVWSRVIRPPADRPLAARGVAASCEEAAGSGTWRTETDG